MATWREAEAAKRERQRTEARFFTPDLLGPSCPVCETRLPLVLMEAGETTHPCCASVEFGTAGIPLARRAS